MLTCQFTISMLAILCLTADTVAAAVHNHHDHKHGPCSPASGAPHCVKLAAVKHNLSPTVPSYKVPDPITTVRSSEGKDTAFTEAASGIATTTLYSHVTGGACGCFDDANFHGFDEQFDFPDVVFAAGSQSIFNPVNDDEKKNGWCGSNCGKCFKLTSQGIAACDTCGQGGSKDHEIVVLMYDLCPPAYLDAQGQHNYCAPKGVKNKQGYYHHFDLHSQTGLLRGMQWDNPLVNFEAFDCPADVEAWYKSKCKKCAGN